MNFFANRGRDKTFEAIAVTRQRSVTGKSKSTYNALTTLIAVFEIPQNLLGYPLT